MAPLAYQIAVLKVTVSGLETAPSFQRGTDSRNPNSHDTIQSQGTAEKNGDFLYYKSNSLGCKQTKNYCIHTVEYYLAIKKTKPLIPTTIWMNYKIIRGSKKPDKETTYCKILFTLNSREGYLNNRQWIGGCPAGQREGITKGMRHFWG